MDENFNFSTEIHRSLTLVLDLSTLLLQENLYLFTHVLLIEWLSPFDNHGLNYQKIIFLAKFQ